MCHHKCGLYAGVCRSLVPAMVQSLRLGRSRIFAAHSCCACAVAGEPGGGGICVVVPRADAPPVGVVEVQSREGRAEACVQAAGERNRRNPPEPPD
jgi:hypothetical protein